MTTTRSGTVSLLGVACMALVLAPVPVRAGSPGQGTEPDATEIGRVCSIIGRESGAVPAEAAPLPVIRRDGRGKIWAAWTSGDEGRNRITLAAFGETGVEGRRTVGLSAGDDVSPDFAFSPSGIPWVIWVNARDGETCVCVLDTSTGAVWNLTAGSTASVASPKILFDADGSAWAFWNAASGQSGEIAYRVFKRGTWLATSQVPRTAKWPAVNPDAAVDDRGTIWLAWSGYDGEDYRIYLSHWTGTGWAREIPVSQNPGCDLFPSLGFEANGNPIVVWTRTLENRRAAYSSSWRDGTAGSETILDLPPDRLSPLRILPDVGGPVLGWSSEGRIRVRSLAESIALGRPAAMAATAPRLLGTLPLDENKYAGFGDSITFGYIDYYPYPERGYIPRLNAILNAQYGSQRLINEGFGGEVTAEGLARIGKVFIADLSRYILIMEGTNDITFTEYTIPFAAFNLREMVRKCLAAGVFPAIATIIPRLDWFGTQALYRDRLLSLNSSIRQIAADMSVPLVEMYSAFNSYPAGSGGVLSLLSKDLKHPSDKGYQFMAETWFSGIRNFPFPPVNITITEQRPEKSDAGRSERRPFAVQRAAQEAPQEPRQPYGNRLTWAPSPKIFDISGVLGYRLYRKLATAPASSLQLLAVIQSPLEYFDGGVAAIGRYDYALSTVRKDGIEGPVSSTAEK